MKSPQTDCNWIDNDQDVIYNLAPIPLTKIPAPIADKDNSVSLSNCHLIFSSICYYFNRQTIFIILQFYHMMVKGFNNNFCSKSD